MASTLAPGEIFTMESLITPTAQGIASRVLARTAAGNITLFAFDVGGTLGAYGAVRCAGLDIVRLACPHDRRRRRADCTSDHRSHAGKCPTRGPRHGGLAHAPDHAPRSPLLLQLVTRPAKLKVGAQGVPGSNIPPADSTPVAPSFVVGMPL